MSAFVVCNTHIDYLLSAGLARRRNVLRWYDVDPAQEMEEDCYQEGNWIGPGAIKWHQAHARELRPDTTDRVGQMLLAENRLSVNHRYAEGEIEEFYTFREVQGPFEPPIVLNALRGYTYQTCEHPGWWKSEARQFVYSLTDFTNSRIVDGITKGWHIQEDEVTYEKGVSFTSMMRRNRDN